jgi:hypothetical protein
MPGLKDCDQHAVRFSVFSVDYSRVSGNFELAFCSEIPQIWQFGPRPCSTGIGGRKRLDYGPAMVEVRDGYEQLVCIFTMSCNVRFDVERTNVGNANVRTDVQLLPAYCSHNQQ